MERKTAEILVKKILEVEKNIDEICLFLKNIQNEHEKKYYLKILASALADISGGVLIPISKEYPDIIDLG